MAHVVVGGPVHASGLALLEAADGVTFDVLSEVSEESCIAAIDRADALILRTQPLTASTVARAGRLKIVSRHGVGYDAVDVGALNARKIALTVVGDVNSISVAEQAMMLMLSAAKRTAAGDRAVRTGDWGWRNRLEPRELWDRQLLIVGYGRAGRHLARLAAGFGMKVAAYDPFLSAGVWPDGPVGEVRDLRAGLAAADFVSLHAPPTPGPLIGPDELAAMKPAAVLVNTARGGLVDEPALIEALRRGGIAAAGLDVFAHEPPHADNPLLAMPNVMVSPHVAGLSAECAERMAVGAAQNVLDFFAGRIDPALVINGAALHG